MRNIFDKQVILKSRESKNKHYTERIVAESNLVLL